MVPGQVLPELDVLKVPGTGFVRLNSFEVCGGREVGVLTGNLHAVRGLDVGGQPAQLLLGLLLLCSLSLCHLRAHQLGSLACTLFNLPEETLESCTLLALSDAELDRFLLLIFLDICWGLSL